MAVEKRGTEKEYYYRKIRSGSKVRSEYIGCISTPFGQLVHRADRLKAAVQASERKVRRTECKSAEDESQALDLLTKVARGWKTFTLLSNHDAYDGVATGDAGSIHFQETCNTIETLMNTELQISNVTELIRQADEGNPEALATLQMLLKNQHDLFIRSIDLVAIARQFVIDSIANGSETIKATVAAQLDQQLANLSRHEVTDEIEKMLLDIMALTYMSAMKAHVLAVLGSETRRGTESLETAANKSLKRFHIAKEAVLQYRHDRSVNRPASRLS